MNELKKQLAQLPLAVEQLIETRLEEFSSFKQKNDEAWFSELCFCLLTANAKAQTALSLQSTLGFAGFCTLPLHNLTQQIKAHKHRFHNNKARYIVAAREHHPIKKIIQQKVSSHWESAARGWLVSNVKGMGYKEASHFLRNTGYQSLAILDRHIINLLVEHNLIGKPNNLAKNNYLQIEQTFQKLSKKLSVTPAKLDLQLWYLQTGKVLK